jgi:hypothetical protein
VNARLKPRHFTVPIDGIPVRVYTDGSLPTPRDVEAIREVMRALRSERERLKSEACK